MPFDVAKLKQPKFAIVAAVALAGGVYFAYRMRQPKAVDTTLTSTPAQPVTDIGQTSQIDALTTQLQQAQQAQLDLEEKQKEAQQKYAEDLAATSQRNADERSQFESRLLLSQQQSATQYDAALATLKDQISSLTAMLAGKTELRQPIPTGTPTSPAIPESPVRHEERQPLPPPSTAIDTNIPGGYPASCVGVLPRTALFPYGTEVSDIRDLQARIARKGNHRSEHIPRLESAMIAIMGVGNQSDVKAAANVYTTGFWAAGALNKVRRENGLRALPKSAIDQLHADCVRWSNTASTFDNNMIRELYLKYYFPYVC